MTNVCPLGKLAELRLWIPFHDFFSCVSLCEEQSKGLSFDGAEFRQLGSLYHRCYYAGLEQGQQYGAGDGWVGVVLLGSIVELVCMGIPLPSDVQAEVLMMGIIDEQKKAFFWTMGSWRTTFRGSCLEAKKSKISHIRVLQIYRRDND